MTTPDPLTPWADALVCPLDRTPLIAEGAGWRCPACGFASTATIVNGVAQPDFRACAIPTVSEAVRPLPCYA